MTTTQQNSTSNKSAVFLTGHPGVGKTTIIQHIIDRLDIPVGGFYTRELRQDSHRIGFEVVTLEGQTAVLATTQTQTFSRPAQFGRYTVDLDAIDRVAVQALHKAWQNGHLIIVDEIGPMEILSQKFCVTIWELLNSGAEILGTIVERPYPFADDIKKHPATDLVLVTVENRDSLPITLMK